MLIAALTTGLVTRIEQNPAVPDSVAARVGELAEVGIPIVPVADVEAAAREEGLPADQAKAVAGDYGEAQLQGLKFAIGAVAFFALISLWFTRGLPGRGPPAAVAAEKRSALAEAR